MEEARDTSDRILDAAERLFARHGIAGTSLRAITREAGVNLASVHYHFGSKDALVEAIYERRLSPINRERLRRLDACEAAGREAGPPLEEVVEAMVAPALRLRADPGRGGESFMCLLSRIHTDTSQAVQPAMRQFDEVRRRFARALGRALPHLSEEELMWRIHFLIGALMHTAGAGHVLTHISQGRCDPADVEGSIRRLVAFVSAGLRAPAAGGSP